MLYPLTGLATLAALLVYFIAGLNVARARGTYGVRAPAVTGAPGFERAFRAQQNTLEWLPLFLPALWLFALSWGDIWSAAIGLLWALARLGYIYAYSADASKRTPYFFAQMLLFMALWLGALIGIARGLL
jgi:glutathione S-transferase